MSQFKEVLDSTVSSYPKGGTPSKVDTIIVPALEEMDDGSLEDFWAAFKDPAVTHPVMATTITSVFKEAGMPISIKAGAIRKYRKQHWPETFGPLSAADKRAGR